MFPVVVAPWQQSSSAQCRLTHRSRGRATAINDNRVNIRLSSADLLDIQAKALAEGLPYQTLIASVLHKYVAGKLAEKQPPLVGAPRHLTPRST